MNNGEVSWLMLKRRTRDEFFVLYLHRAVQVLVDCIFVNMTEVIRLFVFDPVEVFLVSRFYPRACVISLNGRWRSTINLAWLWAFCCED